MTSAVYFQFNSTKGKPEIIPFQGSSISAKDLKNCIRQKCNFTTNDSELKLLTGKGDGEYTDNDLISAYSSVIVQRLPSHCRVNKKTTNIEDFTRRDPYKENHHTKLSFSIQNTNLAEMDIPDDEKLNLVAERSQNLNQTSKKGPVGNPPPHYICNKCHTPGHWINNCPGVKDIKGNFLDSKFVKRPSGIPVDFLREVDEKTPNSYLTNDGKYVVSIKNHEAFLRGKKEKRPFSIEENPPVLVVPDETPECILCALCNKLMTEPVMTPCCFKSYCKTCLLDHLYDPNVDGSRKCPSCFQPINNVDLILRNSVLEKVVVAWIQKKISKQQIEQFLFLNSTGSTVIKNEPKVEGGTPKYGTIGSGGAEIDLFDEIFSCSDKENNTPKFSDEKLDPILNGQKFNYRPEVVVTPHDVTAQVITQLVNLNSANDQLLHDANVYGIVHSMMQNAVSENGCHMIPFESTSVYNPHQDDPRYSHHRRSTRKHSHSKERWHRSRSRHHESRKQSRSSRSKRRYLSPPNSSKRRSSITRNHHYNYDHRQITKYSHQSFRDRRRTVSREDNFDLSPQHSHRKRSRRTSKTGVINEMDSKTNKKICVELLKYFTTNDDGDDKKRKHKKSKKHSKKKSKKQRRHE